MKLEDFDDKKKHPDIVKEIYENFRNGREHENRQAYEKDVKEADKAFIGEVFSSDDESKLEKQGIPICKTNKGAINSIRYASILTAQKPGIDCTPIGGGDSGVATLLKRDFKKVQRVNHANKRYFDCVQDSVKEGLGWIEVFPKKFAGFKNRTIIERVNPECVIVDPAVQTNDLEDPGFKLKYKKITKTVARDVHGLKDDELHYTMDAGDVSRGTAQTVDSEPGGRYDDSPDGTEKDDSILKAFERDIYEIGYYQTIRRSETRMGKWDQTQDKMLTVEQVPEGEEGWEEMTMEYEDLLYVFVVGKKLKYWTLNPLGRDSAGRPIDSLIPLPNISIKKGYPRGNLFFAIPALQEMSKRRGQSIAVVSATSGSPLIARKGLFQNIQEAEKKIRQPRSILEADMEAGEAPPAPLYPTTPDISRVFELEARAEKDADNAWQLNPALKGEAETSKMSGKLNLLLKEAGLEGSSYFMVGLEMFFERVAIAVLATELKYNTPDYWDRLLEEEDFIKTPEMSMQGPMMQGQMPQKQLLPPIEVALQKLKAKDISITDWDIAVQPGSNLPSDRWAKLEFYLELGKNPVHPESPIDQEAILSLLDDPAKGEILGRKSHMKQMQQQNQQMQEGQKKAQGEIARLISQNDEQIKRMKAMEAEMKNLQLVTQSRIDIAVAEEKAKWQARLDAIKDSDRERSGV